LGVGWGRGGYFGATTDKDFLLALMVEVDVEDSGAAMIPDVFGGGEVKEDHALCRLAGADHGFAEEGLGGEGLEVGEGGIDVLKVLLFDGAGGDLFAVGGGEGGVEVLEEEREVKAVVDAQSDEDVEDIFRVLVGDDDGFGFEDGVGGNDDGAGDGQVRGFVRSEAEYQSENDSENEECQENGHQQIASDGLSEFEVGHWQEDSKADGVSGRLKNGKTQFNA
jgi:hypothetical protein